MSSKIESLKIRFYGAKNLDSIPQLSNFSEQDRLGIKAVAQVLPFLTNNYILEQLIDWNNVPNDPMFG